MKQRRNLFWLGLLTLGLAVFGLSRAATSTPTQAKALLLITTSQDGETSPCG